MELKDRIRIAKNHYSHPSQLIGDWQPLGNDWPLMNEYLSGCVVTLVLAMILYFTLSGLAYLFFYVWFKRKFTPRQEELKF